MSSTAKKPNSSNFSREVWPRMVWFCLCDFNLKLEFKLMHIEAVEKKSFNSMRTCWEKIKWKWLGIRWFAHLHFVVVRFLLLFFSSSLWKKNFDGGDGNNVSIMTMATAPTPATRTTLVSQNTISPNRIEMNERRQSMTSATMTLIVSCICPKLCTKLVYENVSSARVLVCVSERIWRRRCSIDLNAFTVCLFFCGFENERKKKTEIYFVVQFILFYLFRVVIDYLFYFSFRLDLQGVERNRLRQVLSFFAYVDFRRVHNWRF